MSLRLVLGALVALVARAAPQQCLTPNASSYTMYMPKQKMNVTVPPIPTSLEKYAYATDKALVAIPKKCVEAFGSKLKGAPNLEDRSPGPTGMYYFRVTNAAKEYAMLSKMSKCACGLVILLHGTSGVQWQVAIYMKMLSGLGYIVVAVDSQAMPEDMGLKGIPTYNTSQINTTDYWGSDTPYNGSCSGFSKPFCYSSSTENILHDPAAYREYLERNYLIRKLELDRFVETQGALLSSFKKVFLMGRSEGAAVAARYYHKHLERHLTGRIFSGWSCDFNYFFSCAEHAKVCEDKCNKHTPQLNLIGGEDQYFGPNGSIAQAVASAPTGWGGNITGNCRAAYDSQGFKAGTVVVLPNSSHSLVPKYDNAVRSLLADFLNAPGESQHWPSLERPGCSEAAGVWRCDDPGNGTMEYSEGWGMEVVANWTFIGTPCSKCKYTAFLAHVSTAHGVASAAVAGLLLFGGIGLVAVRTAPVPKVADQHSTEARALLCTEEEP